MSRDPYDYLAPKPDTVESLRAQLDDERRQRHRLERDHAQARALVSGLRSTVVTLTAQRDAEAARGDALESALIDANLDRDKALALAAERYKRSERHAEQARYWERECKRARAECAAHIETARAAGRRLTEEMGR